MEETPYFSSEDIFDYETDDSANSLYEKLDLDKLQEKKEETPPPPPPKHKNSAFYSLDPGLRKRTLEANRRLLQEKEYQDKLSGATKRRETFLTKIIPNDQLTKLNQHGRRTANVFANLVDPSIQYIRQCFAHQNIEEANKEFEFMLGKPLEIFSGGRIKAGTLVFNSHAFKEGQVVLICHLEHATRNLAIVTSKSIRRTSKSSYSSRKNKSSDAAASSSSKSSSSYATSMEKDTPKEFRWVFNRIEMYPRNCRRASRINALPQKHLFAITSRRGLCPMFKFSLDLNIFATQMNRSGTSQDAEYTVTDADADVLLSLQEKYEKDMRSDPKNQCMRWRKDFSIEQMLLDEYPAKPSWKKRFYFYQALSVFKFEEEPGLVFSITKDDLKAEEEQERKRNKTVSLLLENLEKEEEEEDERTGQKRTRDKEETSSSSQKKTSPPPTPFERHDSTASLTRRFLFTVIDRPNGTKYIVRTDSEDAEKAKKEREKLFGDT